MREKGGKENESKMSRHERQNLSKEHKEEGCKKNDLEPDQHCDGSKWLFKKGKEGKEKKSPKLKKANKNRANGSRFMLKKQRAITFGPTREGTSEISKRGLSGNEKK